MKKTFRYISLFTGAGGLDIGLEKAGLKAVSMYEIDKTFCETLSRNKQNKHQDGFDYFAETKINNVDIREISGNDIKQGNEIDVIVGGPPCQAFSSSGKQLSVLDSRGKLVNEFLRLVDEIKPKMFLFENVRGLVTARNKLGEPGGVITELINQFQNLGYSCRTSLLNSADFGSYQRRVRCFIIASSNGNAPLFPNPTHQKSSDAFHLKWNSLEDFLDKSQDKDKINFVFPTEKLAKELSKIPEGKGLKSIGKVEPTRPSGHWGYRQGTFIADKSLPARTITASSSQDWIRTEAGLRRLTLKEVMLLQGFPEDWYFAGTKTLKFKQVGNAVPIIFGKILGEVIKEHLYNFPTTPPKIFPLPKSFKEYINYTKKDHERNAIARNVHHQFKESN